MQNPGKVNNSDYREKEIMEGNKNLTQDFQNQVSNSKKSLLFLGIFFLFGQLFGQVQFATLQGSPIDTSGWKFDGVARPGVTSNQNTSNSEVILCEKRDLYSSGIVYYKKTLRINPTCSQWSANFDFRIYDGNSADGLSFFYLDNPNNPSKTGGELGIPTSATGIAVVIDTYENCCAVGYNCPNNNNPELQLRILSKTINYYECDTMPRMQLNKLSYLRSTEYQKMTVEYKFDSIYISVRGNLLLKYPVVLNIDGYFGFTAANGGSFDTHSIKNVEITVPRTSLTVDAGRDTTICAGVAVQLGSDSISGHTYTWESTNANYLNSNSIAKPIFLSTTAGLYQLTLRTDSTKAKCYSTDQVTVNVKANPSFKITPQDTLICKGQSVVVPKSFIFLAGTTSGRSISWAPKTNIDTTKALSPNFSPAVSTKYTVKVTNSGTNCFASDTLRIRVDELPLPNVSLGNDTLICENQTLTLKTNTSVSGANFLWNNNVSGSEITINSPGTYWVSSKNLNGCTGQSDTLIVKPCPPEIIQIPNVFTPNNDDKNDSFYIDSRNLDKFQLIVFNRWGEKVYATTDKSAKWEAKNIPDGFYFYQIQYAGLNEYNQSKETKGTIQVIR